MTTYPKKPNWKKRALARGVTLFEVMIVVAILAMVAGGVAVFALPRFREAQIKTAGSAAKVIRTAAQHWRGLGKGDGCPTTNQLVQDKELDPGQDTKDPWGQDFILTCTDDDDVQVTSLGPDKKKGTADDIVVPKGASAPSGD